MIRSSKELKEHGYLNCGGKLEIAGVTYDVAYNHLLYLEGPNDEIFDKLGIRDKKNFCEKAYGYKPSGGNFPQCKIKDYPALTRVAMALFKKAEGKERKRKSNNKK